MSDKAKLILIAAVASGFLSLAAAAGELAIGDPMRPSYLPVASSSSTDNREPSWRVQSIVVSPDRRVAVINGQSLAVGDRILGARVIAIEAYAVTLDIDGTRRQLTLTDARIKTQAERK